MASKTFYVSSLIILIGMYTGCTKPKVYTIYNDSDLALYATTVNDETTKKRVKCWDWEHYVPDGQNLEWFEEKTIRINYHVMYDSEEKHMMPFDSIRGWLWLMTQNSNDRLNDNNKMRLPEGNDTPKLKPFYRYQIVPTPDTTPSEGYFKHLDDELYFYINKGKNRNNYSREVLKKYAKYQDTILNAFVMPAHPDSVKSKTYKHRNAGIALGNCVKFSGFTEPEPKFWEYSTLFNHEVGHVFGLSHSWTKTDGCPDTPPNPNCWHESETGRCKGPTSNNMMDYNSSQMAITPCQLGKIHARIHNLNRRQRKLVVPDWCKYQPNKAIVIHEDRIWMGDKDLNRDIVVRRGATLTLHCRISMAKGATIFVENGGKLVLDNVKLHNDCGHIWGGIRLESKDTKSALVVRGSCVIENAEPLVP